MDGLGLHIAAAATTLSHANVMSDASIALMKNIIQTDEAASGKLIESISEAAPPAGGSGALMDVRA